MTAARRAPLGASGLVWRRLELPVPVDQARVQAFFAAVATLPGGPVVACELIGSTSTVRWRIGALPGALRDVQALALAHLPGVRLVRQSGVAAADAELFRDDLGTDGSVAVANLHVRRRAGAALPSDSAEAVTRSLLAALAATHRARRCEYSWCWAVGSVRKNPIHRWAPLLQGGDRPRRHSVSTAFGRACASVPQHLAWSEPVAWCWRSRLHCAAWRRLR